MSLLQNSNAIPQLGGYNLTDSVRFRSSASAYLTRTPSSAGNRRTFTVSMWVKRGLLDSTERTLVSAGNRDPSYQNQFWVNWSTTGQIRVYGDAITVLTTAVYRDPSAWYHIVVSVDTTQATASNRIKLYVNGSQVTALTTANYPSLNYEFHWNNTTYHEINRWTYNQSQYGDQYLTELYSIDGQALTPSDFGEYDDTTGVWKPKEYTGSYGTNGFYLPMKQTTQASGFNTVTYTGNGTSQSITGVGFQPDLVWFKSRSGIFSNFLVDSVRGNTKYLITNNTDAESTATNRLTSFDVDGFSLGNGGGSLNGTNESNVAWCWDAGSSTVSNTDGTITSSVRANPDYGFSVVTYNATTTGTVGHGLGSAPKVIILKYRDIVGAWITYHSELGNATKILLNATDASSATSYFNSTDPTNDVFSSTLGGGNTVAYCFSEVSGFSKFGSYTGNGTSQSINLGFRPAFVMWKRIDAAGNSWIIKDNTRYADNQGNLFPNATTAENTDTNVTFTDTGFDVDSAAGYNGSGRVFIYMAFADTRDFQWNFDSSGNKNNWTPTNINSNASSETTYDIMSDVPTLTDEDTANFATLNPLTKYTSNTSVVDGNLKANGVSGGSGIAWGTVFSSITIPTSGKFYVEGQAFINAGIGNNSHLGILDTSTYIPSASNITFQYTTGEGFDGIYASLYSDYVQAYSDGVASGSSVTGLTATTINVMLAFDVDAGKVWAGYNGTWLNSGNPSAGTGEIATRTFSTTDAVAVGTVYTGTNDQGMIVNFGQRPFTYTPPTGFKKLNTYNLPDSAIKDGSQYMNPVTYTGNGSTNAITGVGFSPDFVWLKSRSLNAIHAVFDTVRGGTKRLRTNDTVAEDTSTALTTFDADGFTLGNDYSANNSGSTFVAWNWRGSDSTAVSNTDGGITSTVSANTTSGFSVVTYTGTGVAGTVGHGLGIAPSMIIYKSRSNAQNWLVNIGPITGTQGDYVYLNKTDIKLNSANVLNPTSNTFGLVTSPENNQSGITFVAYCFAEVEGFSKFGSYTGNGSADGPFVYTGFRPAFVLLKSTGTANGWAIHDTSRKTYNVDGTILEPNSSNAEATYTQWNLDMLSNGFKVRSGNYNESNASGVLYIYMAFASNPFKNSLAR